MKEFILKIIKFVLFGTVMYLIGLILCGELLPQFLHKNLAYLPGVSGHIDKRMNDLRKTKNIDILFLGSSRSYRSFDTRMYDSLGLSNFNLGSSNQTPIQTLFLLKRYLDQLEPKQVILEVDPIIMDNDGTESTIDIISNDYLDWSSLDLVQSTLNVRTVNSLIYAYYAELFNRKSSSVGRQEDRDVYVGSGYVAFTDNTLEKDKILSYTCGIRNEQIIALDSILSLLNQKDIAYYLVQTPVISSVFKSCSQNSIFDSLMMARGHYINFNHFLKLNDSLDFRDGVHINQNGTYIFNEALIDSIY